MKHSIWFRAALFILVLIPSALFAQESCGDIVFFEPGDVQEMSIPIADCDNPFQEIDSPLISEVRQIINEEISLPSTEPILPWGGPGDVKVQIEIEFPGVPEQVFINNSLYQAEGDGYRRINLAGAGVTYDGLNPGEYVLVTEVEFAPVLSQDASLMQRLVSFMIPKVHAQFNDFATQRVARTFVYVGEGVVPEPAGASSVLFLPGIQASRLYTDGVFGTEDKIWVPNNIFGQDVLDLEMTSGGESVNDVYTRDLVDSALGVKPIYASLISFFDSLVSEEVINRWQPYAYDWRYSVQDVVQNGTQYQDEIKQAQDIVVELAETSKSEKVTIVAHSNGGLLAKALMIELERSGQDNLIDTVVFLASPQVGTPKAIGSVLHGYDQGLPGGLFIKDQTARTIIKNLPGAYGLVPSEAYFDMTDQPVVTFADTPITRMFSDVYGDSIDTTSGMFEFMSAADSDADPQNINDASAANTQMLSGALEYHQNELDHWRAPDGVNVIEIVGTGIDTVSGFEYEEFLERRCIRTGQSIVCDEEMRYKPTPLLTQNGDGTVVEWSAAAYGGEKETYFVDLLELDVAAESDISLSVVEHADIGEAGSVQSLLANILKATTSDIRFISSTAPTYTGDKLLIATYSPVSLEVTDEQGRRTGLQMQNGLPTAQTDIPGSSWFTIASSSFVVIPSNISHTVSLTGTGDGAATYVVHELNEAGRTQLAKVVIPVITPETVVTSANDEDVVGNLLVDQDGDGEVDAEFTPQGQLVEDQPEGYDALRAEIVDLDLPRSKERLVLRFVSKAEYYADKEKGRLEKRYLRITKKLLRWYYKRNLIDEEEWRTINSIIKDLK